MLVVNQAMDIAVYIGEGTTVFTNDNGDAPSICAGLTQNICKQKRSMTGLVLGKFSTDEEADRVFRDILCSYRDGVRLYFIPRGLS